MKEHGIFHLDGSFTTKEEIMAKSAQATDEVVFLTPLSKNEATFQDMAERFTRRQEEALEAKGIPEHVEIKINTQEPVMLALFGDVHAGGLDVDYKRFAKEVNYVAGTPGCYALCFGDLTESFFWGGSAGDETIASFQEENHFIRSGLKMLADRKKLLAAWAGDHDSWSAERGETMYSNFGENMGAHLLDGVSYISLLVGDELYKISGAHRHNGFSIYNRSHAALRLYRDSSEGADIIVTAHMHKKANQAQPVKKFGGEEDVVQFISLGAYKRTDRYLRKRGFGRAKRQDMGAHSILLWPDRKKIDVCWTIEEGLEKLSWAKAGKEVHE